MVKFLLWVTGWMMVLFVAKSRAKGGGGYEEGFFQAFFKSSLGDLEARGERVLEDDRPEQAAEMGSWAPGQVEK